MFTSSLVKKSFIHVLFSTGTRIGFIRYVVENIVVHSLSNVTNGLNMHFILIYIKHVFWSSSIASNGIINVRTIKDVLHLWFRNQPICMIEFDHASAHSVVFHLK